MHSSEGPIVAGWDGTEGGRDAAALARILARARGATLVVAHSFYAPVRPYPLPDEFLPEQEARAASELQQAAEAIGAGVAVETFRIPGQSPAHALHDFAEAHNAQLVVIGSTHHGKLGRIMLGSITDRFLHGAPCPVAIPPRGYAATAPDRLSVIAAAYDGSPEADMAVRTAAALAHDSGATLRIIAVVEPLTSHLVPAIPEITETQHEYIEGQFARITGELPDDLAVETRIRDGFAAEEIREEARAGVDLMVTGSRGYGPIRRVLLGSVSGAVVRDAPSPVLVVPRSAEQRVEMHAATEVTGQGAHA
jgi:nucleotide-binding universal stress UspA family protein